MGIGVADTYTAGDPVDTLYVLGYCALTVAAPAAPLRSRTPTPGQQIPPGATHPRRSPHSATG